MNARLPGNPFGDEHRLLPLAVRMLEEMPIVALLVQMGWCRPPVEEIARGIVDVRHLVAFASTHGCARALRRSGVAAVHVVRRPV